MIYLDNAATAKVLLESACAALSGFLEFFLNPSALYKNAGAVRDRINDARNTIASLLHAEPEEIYFTSGATEANNLAVFGGGLKKQKLAAVTSDGEHASVYECFVDLKRRGIETRFAPLDCDTSVDVGRLIGLSEDNCGFVSLIHASNETGVVNHIAEIFKEIRKKNPGAVLHSDGVQAFLKIETDVKKLGVDLYSVSGHKIGAPKGIGALYIRKGLEIRPLMFGGGQEKGRRAGTENVPGILAFAAAVNQYKRKAEKIDFTAMRKIFVEIVRSAGGVILNGSCAEDSAKSLDHIISMSVIGLKSEILQRVLADKDGILIGTGSACAASKSGNRVLSAAGKSTKEIEGNIRVSFGIDTTAEDVIAAAKKIAERIIELGGRHGQ